MYFLFKLQSSGELRPYLSGTGIQHLTGESLHQLSAPLPPLPEQQRIVAILDEAFAAISTAQANAEKNLQNCISLWTSLLDSTLDSDNSDWLHRPLADLCSIRHGFAFDGEFFTSEGEFVLLTPGNFFETGGYRDRGMKQKYYRGEIPEGYILQEGDLLVAMTEQAAGLLGSPLIVPASERFLHNQRLGLVIGRPDAAWDSHFFYFVFNTTRVRREIHASASGVKVRHTSPSKIGEVVVSFPTELSQQRAIAARLTEMSEETQRLESIYRRKLTALDELKKSLLHQAFHGDL